RAGGDADAQAAQSPGAQAGGRDAARVEQARQRPAGRGVAPGLARLHRRAVTGRPGSARVLISSEELHTRVRQLGASISSDHRDGAVLVAVLKGSTLFLADLMRAITVHVELDFLAVSS